MSEFSTNQIVDEGYASRLYRVTVKFLDANDLATSYILKLATDNPTQKELLEDSALMREVFFYQELAPEIHQLLPKIYCASADFESRQLTLLMEDLGEIPHKAFEESLENSVKAISELARVHAKFWNADLLSRAELTPIDSQLSTEQVQTLFDDNLKIEAEADYEFPYLRKCIKLSHALTPWLAAETNQFRGATTLNHGDFHARNIHFGEQRTTIFDWQQAERGRPVRDVIYWMLLSVTTADFPIARKQLITTYLDSLADAGVRDYKESAFNQDMLQIAGQVIPRVYCYQTLVEWSGEDSHELVGMLERAELMAKSVHLLALLRVARVLSPMVITIMRWLGLR